MAAKLDARERVPATSFQDILAALWEAHFFRAAKSTTGIMAALKDVAEFGRRINIDDQGMTFLAYLWENS